MSDKSLIKRSDAAYKVNHLIGEFELTCGYRAVGALGALFSLLGEHGHQLSEKQCNSLSVHLERAVKLVCRSVQPYADTNSSNERMDTLIARISLDTAILRDGRGQETVNIDKIRRLLGDQAADELEMILNRDRLER